MFAIDNNKKTCYNYTKLMECNNFKDLLLVSPYFFCIGRLAPFEKGRGTGITTLEGLPGVSL